MSPVADLPGFLEAQNTLRSNMGSPVIFKVPVKQTWPGGTKINPDTKLPYDPTINPTSVAFTEVTKTVHIVLKHASPLRPQADTQAAASGEMSGMDVILDLSEADYPAVENATEMVVNGLPYRIREFKPFSLGGIIYRWLVYGQEH